MRTLLLTDLYSYINSQE